jgi:hypothetical protein
MRRCDGWRRDCGLPRSNWDRCRRKGSSLGRPGGCAVFRRVRRKGASAPGAPVHVNGFWGTSTTDIWSVGSGILLARTHCRVHGGIPMTRAFVTTAFALGLIAVACSSTAPPPGPASGTAGGAEDAGASSSGAGSGASSSGTGTSASSSTSGGMSSSSSSGGASTVDDGGSSGTAGSSSGSSSGNGSADAQAQDATEPADASPVDADFGDASWLAGSDPAPDGKAGIYLCPKAWTQEQCCAFLCTCVEHLCTDSPLDAPRIPMCMTMCNGLSDMRARCQVYHCFESVSPTGMKDHDSHCGHASGRVGGGACPYTQ